MIDGWFALIVLIACPGPVSKFLPLPTAPRAVHHSPMTALAESVSRAPRCRPRLFLSGNLPALPQRNARRPGKASSVRHCWSQVRFIDPPFCERCGLPYPGDLTAPFECANCREMELHFSSARSAVVAHGVVREAIHRYKYQRALWFEPFLAGLLLREGHARFARTGLGFHRARAAASVETARTRIQPGRTAGLHLERRHRNPVERQAAPAGQAHRHPDAAHAASSARRTCAARLRFAPAPGWTASGWFWWTTCSPPARRRARARKAFRAAGAGEVCVWTVARGL